MMQINRSTNLNLPKRTYHSELLATQAKNNLLNPTKTKSREDFIEILSFLRNNSISPKDLKTFVQAKSKESEETLLHILCQESEVLCSAEKEKLVPILLRAGADVNAVNNREETPLDIAKKNKDNSLIQLLKDFKGKTLEELREWKITVYEFFNAVS